MTEREVDDYLRLEPLIQRRADKISAAWDARTRFLRQFGEPDDYCEDVAAEFERAGHWSPPRAADPPLER